MRLRSVSAALCGVAATLCLTGPIAQPAAAQEDVRKELRLNALDGKFTEVDRLLAEAPDEVKNDPKLRKELGEKAAMWARRKDGPEKIPGLIAASEHLATAARLAPDDAEAALGALDHRIELVKIQIEAKQPTRAKEHAEWASRTGEELLAAGADTPPVRMSLAAAHDHVAKLAHKVEEFDKIVTAYGRSADLLVSCADTAKNPAEALGGAARAYLDLSTFVADGRPIEEETRDEEALRKAIEVATQACETKGAQRDQYLVHFLALREAHRRKLPGSHGRPYMQELGKKEGVDGLNLHLPKAGGWSRLSNPGEWDMVIERKHEDDTSAVQVMIRVWEFSQSFGGKTWDRVEEVAKLRFDEQKANDFKDVATTIEPEQLDTGKKGPEIWHFEIAGTGDGRTRRVAEWMMMRAKKDKVTFQIRLIDWRSTPDLKEPDIVEFLRLALDLPEPEADDDDKKGKKPKKGRR
mgnify:CR=1 FL=1